MSSTDVASLMVRAGYGEVDGEDVTRSSSAVRVPASPRMEGGGETPPSRYRSHLPVAQKQFPGPTASLWPGSVQPFLPSLVQRPSDR